MSQTLRQVTCVAVFGAMALASMVGFLHTFPPKPRLPSKIADESYDPRAMRQAMAPAAVEQKQEAILAQGSRFLGQKGFYATEVYLREAYQKAGLKVYEYHQQSVAPRTLERRIVGGDGQELPGTEIYPLFPNLYQPMVTPPAGVSGELLLVSDEVLYSRTRFDDCIALIDAAEVPPTYGLQWSKYAQAGFAAVIVADHAGLEKIKWRDTLKLVGTLPVNYVRLAAGPGIFGHVGEKVTLHVRTRYENLPHTTLVGVLEAGAAPAGPRQAVVVGASYDAPSCLPDLAPGTLSAVAPAMQLALLEGLLPYRQTLQRDVVFVATGGQMMAQDGFTHLLAVLGTAVQEGGTRLRLERDLAADRQKLAAVEAVLKCFDESGFLVDPQRTARRIEPMAGDAKALLDEQVHYVLNTLVRERSEDQLAANLVFKRTGENDKSPEFQAYRTAKDHYDAVQGIAGYSLGKLLGDSGKLAEDLGLRGQTAKRFTALREFHQQQVTAGSEALAIHDRLRSYESFGVLLPDLLPADAAKVPGDVLSIFMGEQREDTGYVQYPVINQMVDQRVQKAGVGKGFRYDSLQPVQHSSKVASKVPDLQSAAKYWNLMGYPTFSLINTDRVESYDQRAFPVALPYMRQLASLTDSLKVTGDLVVWLGHGNGVFMPPIKQSVKTFSGRVYVANVGQSIVPNYPLAGALWGAKQLPPLPTTSGSDLMKLGYFRQPLVFTDPYGRYCLPDYVGEITGYSPEAVGFGADGRIDLIKDEGPQGQSVYRSIGINLSTMTAEEINLVLFRAAPVTLLDLVNPQTLQPYAAVELLARQGLASLPQFYTIKADDAIATFIPPEQQVFVALKAGTADNPTAQVTRAFMLGIKVPGSPDNTGPGATAPTSMSIPGQEIAGPGYLAADAGFLLDTSGRVAASMLQVNGQRLDLQNHYHMADPRTNKFQTQAQTQLDEAANPDLSQHQRTLLKRDAVAYSTLNHPVLRQNTWEAVAGILWYLGLLVPFCFFFEKLVFGLSDIRKQLLVQTLIILVVFGLLKLLHPAFEMIRSSLMILLGFVILLISTGITVLFAGKFQENLEGMRKQRGQVSAAQVDTMGVIGTAFMLGLNNMHRRKVRTGLTCATLVLIMFAMICFTSVTSDLTDQTYAVGKAAYQGLLIKYPSYEPISAPELFAVQSRYGHDHAVAPRKMYVGHRTEEAQIFNPQLDVVYAPTSPPSTPGTPAAAAKPLEARRAGVGSLLVLTDKEPLQKKIKLLTRNGWFSPPPVKATNNPPQVMLPDTMARTLGLTPDEVDAHRPLVQINGKPCTVWGIFEAAAFAQLRDLDGRTLLPFDAESIQVPRLSNKDLLASETDAQIPAERVVLAATATGADILPNADSHAYIRLASIAVDLQDLAYKPARQAIDTYLEQSGKETYYGLQGVAYKGQRTRGTNLAGMLELIVPLIVAAITVLNTMRGSVYERRDEIFVYNAVGIAPRYVFFMFFAEAFVYAIVGAVLGYLLSQGLGRILTELNWTGGLNMTFTNLNTVIASLAVALAVFLSTLFPARSAMKIATPAEDQGWALPPAQGDTIGFDLPFTFGRHDRIAVLEFFNRIFLDHGEGGAGQFHAAKPVFGVAADAAGEYVPEISTTIWLKPFDLGVSQRLAIRLPTDPETGEYIAQLELTRLSGTRESWLRLNTGFVTLVRKHFLEWHAVAAAERTSLFAQARRQLETQVLAAPDQVAAGATEMA